MFEYTNPLFWIMVLSGLGLFLYGINSISSVLKKIAGNALRKVINKCTSNRFLGFLVGSSFTAIIQSSSATSTLAISLVRAGVMTMIQAAAIIVGANIGTTITAFIISLPIAQYLSICILIGAFILLLVAKAKWKNIGELLFALGSIFLGLWIMEINLKSLPGQIPAFNDIFTFLAQWPWLGLLVGAVITAMLQSSSAVIGILQGIFAAAALAGSPIPLFGLVPILFGSNIGTTTTALLACIGGSKESKRVAIFHMFFNTFGSLLFMGIIYIPPLKAWLINPDNFVGFDPKILLALVHLVFNSVVACIFLPLLSPICKLLEIIAPGTTRTTPSIIIEELDSRIMKEFPAEGLSLAKEQVVAMFSYSQTMFEAINDYLINKNNEDAEFALELEASIDRIDRQMNDYLLTADKGSLSYNEMREFTRLLRGCKDIERIGDYGENLINFYMTANERKNTFPTLTMEVILRSHQAAIEMIKDTINVFKNGNKDEAVKIIQRRRAENKRLEEDTERLFDNMGKDEKSKSSYTDLVFFDIISCYQRVYSHCSNIAKLFGTDKEYVYTKNEEEHFASLRNRY